LQPISRFTDQVSSLGLQVGHCLNKLKSRSGCGHDVSPALTMLLRSEHLQKLYGTAVWLVVAHSNKVMRQVKEHKDAVLDLIDRYLAGQLCRVTVKTLD